MAKQKIIVDGTTIRINQNDYVSLTDIAKRSTDREPSQVIRSWLRNRDTINFLATWEKVHNPSFKPVQMDRFREQASDNRRKISPQSFIEKTGAIGITSKSGRYGGTFSHSDIALNFCYWLSPEFQVYFLKEFQRLKEQEARNLNIEWNIRRELAKVHYPMLKEAVIEKMPKGKKKPGFYLADEADLINDLVFGITAQKWRKKYPNHRGNMRDNATVEQLLLISDLQIVDSLLIKWDCDKQLRIDILNKFAHDLRGHFSESPAMRRLKEIQNRSLK